MLLLTRPQADSEKIQHRLAALGIESLIDPLLTMRTHIPPSQDIASAMDAPALLFTSKNAFPAVTAFPELREKTVYCVGNATATTAKQHGFHRVAFVAPTVQTLLNNLRTCSQSRQPASENGGFLRNGAECTLSYMSTVSQKNAICSKGSRDCEQVLTEPVFYFRGEHITQPLPPKFLTGESIVYSALAAKTLSEQTLTHFNDATIHAVGLWSARTADIFANLMLAHQQQARLPHLTLFCLSNVTAAAHPLLTQARCVISASPDTESLLQTIVATGKE